MNVSLTEAQLRKFWDFSCFAGNSYYAVIELLCPPILKRICEIQFALFAPLVADDLTHPAAIKLLTAATDPHEIEQFRLSVFGPNGGQPCLFDDTEIVRDLTQKALLWCTAQAYFNLGAYSGALLNLSNMYLNDALGHDEDTPAHALRAIFYNDSGSQRIAQDNAHANNAYEEITFRHFKQALAELRGFTPE